MKRRPFAPIAGAVRRFKWDTGRWPSTEEGLRALFSAPRGTEDMWRGPYLDTPPAYLLDPWCQPIRYRCPAKYGTEAFELWSNGPNLINDDGKPGSDDVGNWRTP